jgi:hypothetical protein
MRPAELHHFFELASAADLEHTPVVLQKLRGLGRKAVRQRASGDMRGLQRQQLGEATIDETKAAVRVHDVHERRGAVDDRLQQLLRPEALPRGQVQLPHSHRRLVERQRKPRPAVAQRGFGRTLPRERGLRFRVSQPQRDRARDVRRDHEAFGVPVLHAHADVDRPDRPAIPSEYRRPEACRLVPRAAPMVARDHRDRRARGERRARAVGAHHRLGPVRSRLSAWRRRSSSSGTRRAGARVGRRPRPCCAARTAAARLNG